MGQVGVGVWPQCTTAQERAPQDSLIQQVLIVSLLGSGDESSPSGDRSMLDPQDLKPCLA